MKIMYMTKKKKNIVNVTFFNLNIYLCVIKLIIYKLIKLVSINNDNKYIYYYKINFSYIYLYLFYSKKKRHIKNIL